MNIIFGLGDSSAEAVYNIIFGLNHFYAIIEGLIEQINLNLNTKSEVNLIIQDILINCTFIINMLSTSNLVTQKIEDSLNISINQKNLNNTTYRF